MASTFNGSVANLVDPLSTSPLNSPSHAGQHTEINDALQTAGVFQSYTPTFTGFTLGNGVVTSRYMQLNKLIHYTGYVDLGSTSSMAGPLDISLPVACNGTAQPFLAPFAGQWLCWNGSSLFDGYPINIGTGVCRLVGRYAAGTYSQNYDMGSTVPFTWGSSSYFYWNFLYEAA